MAHLITALNPVQEDMVKQFIECGGRGVISQQGRGQGYTTGLMYLAMQQALHTRRKVVFVTSEHVYSLRGTVFDVAQGFFKGVTVAPVEERMNHYLIGGNLLRILKPTTNAWDGIKGYTIDDVFMDVSYQDSWKYEEFYYTLNARASGQGFHFTVAR